MLDFERTLERALTPPLAPPASGRGRSSREGDIVTAMQTRYLIIASLVTAMVILVAGAWWLYARAV